MTPPRRTPRDAPPRDLDGPGHVPDADARQEALARSGGAAGPSSRAFRFAVGLAIVGAVAVNGLVRYGLSHLPVGAVPPWLVELGGMAVTMGSLLLVARFLFRRRAAAIQRRRLVDRGTPVCIGCGYRLHGLPIDAASCPECGAAIDDDAAWLLKAEAHAASVDREAPESPEGPGGA